MLKGISKKLNGEMLKVLSEMGHGDVLVLADANFPAARVADTTTHKTLISAPGLNIPELLEAITEVFPLDYPYTGHPVVVMHPTMEDEEKGLTRPPVWEEIEKIVCASEKVENAALQPIERQGFYARAGRAFAIIQTGEERPYANVILVKGCVR